MNRWINRRFNRRNIIYLAGGYLFSGLVSALPSSRKDSFEAVFVNYFPDISDSEITAWYERIYNVPAIERLTERYVQQGLILSRNYKRIGRQDEMRLVFGSEDAFLKWDRELFALNAYNHKVFIESGFTAWSNIPRRLEKNDFYGDRLNLFKV